MLLPIVSGKLMNLTWLHYLNNRYLEKQSRKMRYFERLIALAFYC